MDVPWRTEVVRPSGRVRGVIQAPSNSDGYPGETHLAAEEISAHNQPRKRDVNDIVEIEWALIRNCV